MINPFLVLLWYLTIGIVVCGLFVVNGMKSLQRDADNLCKRCKNLRKPFQELDSATPSGAEGITVILVSLLLSPAWPIVALTALLRIPHTCTPRET